MRLRIILLAVATSSLVLVSFLLPLALVLRALAADRAVSTATVQAQWMAPLAATLKAGSLRLAVDQVNAASRGTPVTVFLPGGGEVGAPVRRSPAVNAAVQLAARGRSFTSDAPGGVEVLVAVQGLPHGTAVIRTFVPDAELRHGVTRAWLLLGCVGLGLLVLSVAVADQLARSLVRPLRAVAGASDRLATGDLSARAELTGPPEVRRAGAGLNRLAVRIGELLTRERETVADLSHRLRTPLTALRIDAESLRNHAERAQVLADVDALERTVDEIIREARRPTRDGSTEACDAGEVVAERAAFWLPLAEDTERAMTVELARGPMPVRASGEDLAACLDILLENVFAHTPEGAGLAIRLSRGPAAAPGWSWPTTGRASATGTSPSGAGPAPGPPAWASTSPGASPRASGGTLTIGRSASGGGSVTLGLGPPAAPEEGSRRHRRTRALPGVLSRPHRPTARPARG